MLKNFQTYQLALKFYKETRKLKLKGEIKDQLNRASLSIVLNLAEGSGKESTKDRKRFFQMAFCSIREVQAILEILENSEMTASMDLVAAHCFKLIKSLPC